MADKNETRLTIREVEERLRILNVQYGRGAQVTVDKDFNFQVAHDDDLEEETPEQSAKRAERQAKNDGEAVEEVKVVNEKPTQALKDRKAAE